MGADLLFASDASTSLNLNGSLTLSITKFSASSLAAGTKFTLFSYNTGWNTGIFTELADDTTFTAAGQQWSINYNDTSAGLNILSDATAFGTSFATLTVVPEPNTVTILVGGLGMLLGWGRFRGCDRREFAFRGGDWFFVTGRDEY